MSKSHPKTQKPVKDSENHFKSPKNSPKVLLVGYNGANNTGSEARLLAIIEDVKTVLGADVQITIPTLNEKNLRRYLKEESGMNIAPIPSIFFWAERKLVNEHDLVILVEGSCYMDSWTEALLWAFLYATRCAHSAGVPCIAYAVDSGKLSSFNRFLVRREASKTDLIITRTQRAAEELKSIGVTAPMEITADCAFNFKVDDTDVDILRETWPEAGTTDGVAGLAVVDFYLWPVVIRPWGKKEYVYRWPYYFSRSKARRNKSNDLARGWAREADRIIEKSGKSIALICMEDVDQPLAHNILDKMKNSDKARVYSSSELNASQMTQLLRSLDLLVTSRYHAGVLSLEARIPQIAVGHDTRLKGLYEELKLPKDYLIDCYSADLWSVLQEKVDDLLENPDEVEKIREILKRGYEEHLNRSLENQKLLRKFLTQRGWVVNNEP